MNFGSFMRQKYLGFLYEQKTPYSALFPKDPFLNP